MVALPVPNNTGFLYIFIFCNQSHNGMLLRKNWRVCIKALCNEFILSYLGRSIFLTFLRYIVMTEISKKIFKVYDEYVLPIVTEGRIFFHANMKTNVGKQDVLIS